MTDIVTDTVNPWSAIRLPDDLPSRRDVRHQARRLVTEGQIEPLVGTVNQYGVWTIDNSDWPYATAQVWAARLLRDGIDPEGNFAFTHVRSESGPEWTLMVTNERDN